MDQHAEVTLPAGAPPRDLAGRVALVTGSTSGIGLGVAQMLAARGAALVLNGRRPAAEAEALRQGLAEAAGVPALYHAADVGDADAVAGLVAQAVEAFGRVDILVNNAGVQHVAPLEGFAIERWDEVVGVNLRAAFLATRAVFAGMKARGWGRIVNVASAHALVASPYKAAYVAAKHGLVGLTKVVALEGAAAGVTCNAVCPGYVHTPLVERQVAAQAAATGVPRERVIEEVLLAQQPNRRFTSIEEVAAMIAFLCGPHASGITGAALTMDGGWTAR